MLSVAKKAQAASSVLANKFILFPEFCTINIRYLETVAL